MTDLRFGLGSLVIGASLALAGCGGGTDMPMGPGATGPGGMPAGGAGLMSVTPGGGAMAVPVGTPLELRWGVAMGAGMEQFVDLHMHVGGSHDHPRVSISVRVLSSLMYSLRAAFRACSIRTGC